MKAGSVGSSASCKHCWRLSFFLTGPYFSLGRGAAFLSGGGSAGGRRRLAGVDGKAGSRASSIEAATTGMQWRRGRTDLQQLANPGGCLPRRGVDLSEVPCNGCLIIQDTSTGVREVAGCIVTFGLKFGC